MFFINIDSIPFHDDDLMEGVTHLSFEMKRGKVYLIEKVFSRI